MIFHNEDKYDTVIKFKLHGLVTGFDIIAPADEYMEIFPMYEVTHQIIWYPQDNIHDNNKKAYQLSQGVEPINHWIMMVDTNSEYGSNITRVNLSALCKMDPTMMTLLIRNKYDNTLYSSDYDSYHQVNTSDDGMDISGSDTYIRKKNHSDPGRSILWLS